MSLSADNQLIAWNTNPEWTLERTVGGDSQQFADRVISLAFSHDGKLLATGGGEPSRTGEVKIWDVALGKLVRSIPDAHSDTVFGIEFSPDDTVLATCAADKFVKLHTVADGKWIKSFEGHTHHVLGVSWQPNGKMLASCGADMVITNPGNWHFHDHSDLSTTNNGMSPGGMMTMLMYEDAEKAGVKFKDIIAVNS